MVKNMLNIIDNALRDKSYYICLYDNKIYIYNYKCILSFSDKVILVKLVNQNIKIKGLNLKIKRLEKVELLIEGIISGVLYE